jgi:hypothetical protein
MPWCAQRNRVYPLLPYVHMCRVRKDYENPTNGCHITKSGQSQSTDSGSIQVPNVSKPRVIFGSHSRICAILQHIVHCNLFHLCIFTNQTSVHFCVNFLVF